MKTSPYLVLALVLMLLSPTACAPQPETYVIGLLSMSPAHDIVIEGFKDGLAEAGYVEGENVTYIFEGATGSPDGLEPAAQGLLAADIDLMFALTTPGALVAKQATEGTDVPVVFAPVTDSVASGIVDSLRSPGGNLTGVQTRGYIPKQLEWTLTLVPGAETLLVLHNPVDTSSSQGFDDLEAAIPTFDVELVVVEVTTRDEVVAALAAVPQEVDAIFVLPAGLFSGNIDAFVDATLAHNLPLATGSPQYQSGALFSHGPVYYEMGSQASRLAVKILQGADPSDLPVEQVDYYLGINLQTARAIGLDIPDDILQQAHDIIR